MAIMWKWPFDLWPLNGGSDVGVTVDTFVSLTIYNMLTVLVLPFEKVQKSRVNGEKGHWPIMTFCWPLTGSSWLTFLFCSSSPTRYNKPEQNQTLFKILQCTVQLAEIRIWPFDPFNNLRSAWKLEHVYNIKMHCPKSN